MGTPHKHRDAIIAWANGEEIEWMNPSGKWQKIDESNWIEYHQYRIKPKMVRKETGGSAFPNTVLITDEAYADLRGMTMRDYFAAKAMVGILCDPKEVQPYTNDQLAQWSYQVADAMLKAREQ